MTTTVDNTVVRTTVSRKTEYLTTGNILTDETSDPQGLQYYDSRTRAKSTLQSSGWRNPLPYSRFVRRVRSPSGVATYEAGSGSSLRRVTLTGLFGPQRAAAYDPQFPVDLRRQAEVEALSNLKDQKVNLAQAFAERDQTARLLGDTARRIAKAFRALRRGDPGQAAYALGISTPGPLGRRSRQWFYDWRNIPGAWLQYRYGWQPLLSDVYGSAQLLAQAYAVPEAWLVTVKGTSQSSETFEELSANLSALPPEFRKKTTSSHKCFVRLDYTASSAFMRNLNQLGVSNPLQLAWELIPYSFVVDWAFGIGDWLSVMDAASGLSFRSGSRSELSKSLVEQFPTSRSDATYRKVSNQCYGGMAQRIRLNRFVYTDSPIPGLPSPSFSNFTLSQMADGLSLLASAFRRQIPSGIRR